MKRRDFIKLSALMMSGLSLSANAALNGISNLIYNESNFPYGGKYLINARNDVHGLLQLTILDTTTKEFSLIPLAFLPHTVIPIDDHRIVLPEKYGRSISLVDFKKAKILSTYTIPKHIEEMFMGHGVYHPETKHVYVTEQYDYDEIHQDALKGYISVRELPSFKEVRRFDSGGNGCHDMVIDDNGNLVVCNTSGLYPSLDKQTKFWLPEYRNIAIIEPHTGNILKKIAMPNSLVCPGHIKKIGSEFIVGGINSHLDELRDYWWKHKNVTVLKVDSNYQTSELTYPDYMVKSYPGEFLSIAINPITRVVGVTNPQSNSIHFWHLDKKIFLAEIEEKLAKSISNSSDYKTFIVTGNERTIFIDAEKLTVSESSLPFLGNGMSHTYLL